MTLDEFREAVRARMPEGWTLVAVGRADILRDGPIGVEVRLPSGNRYAVRSPWEPVLNETLANDMIATLRRQIEDT